VGTVEAANNACIIRNQLVAVQKGSRVAVADLKVSTRLNYIEKDVEWVID